MALPIQLNVHVMYLQVMYTLLLWQGMKMVTTCMCLEFTFKPMQLQVYSICETQVQLLLPIAHTFDTKNI